MKSRYKFNRITSFIVLISFTFSNIVLGQGNVDTFWLNRQKSLLFPSVIPSVDLLKIPAGSIHSILSQFGAVSDQSSSRKNVRNQPQVIFIQDVHMNPEAQSNISKALGRLISTKKLSLVALEGAFGAVDVASFRSYPHQETIRLVASSLLKEKKISGAMEALYSSPVNIPPVLGVDDFLHYNQNVAAYKKSTRVQRQIQKEWALWGETLTTEQGRLNPELKSFVVGMSEYRSGKKSLVSYVGELMKFSSRFNFPEYNDMDNFYKAAQLENKINFSQLEKDRSSLLNHFLFAVSLAGKNDLLTQIALYRDGKATHGEFYGYLKRACKENGLSLQPYPALELFFEYAALADSIKTENIFKAMSLVEKRVGTLMAQTSSEVNFIDQLRRHYLVGRLLHFSLTRDEWDEYKSLANGDPFISKTHSFVKFYQEADQRDLALASNLLRAIQDGKKELTVLVAGGFHSKGVLGYLKKNGVSTLIFTPRISKVKQGDETTYLSTFTQEKAPLEKLFHGEPLFLAPMVDAPAIRREMAARFIALETLAGRGSQAIRFFGDILLWPKQGFVKAIRVFGRAYVCVFTWNGFAFLSSWFDSKKEIHSIQWATALPFTSGIRKSNKPDWAVNILIQGAESNVLNSVKNTYGTYEENNLRLAIEAASEKYPEIKFEGVSYEVGITDGPIAFVTNENHIFIDLELLGHSELLKAMMLEEFRHLLFIRMSYLEQKNSSNEVSLLGAEEALTDLSLIKRFRRLQNAEERTRFLLPLVRGLDAGGIYTVLLAVLSEDDRQDVLGEMKSINPPASELMAKKIQDIGSVDEELDDMHLIEILLSFYRKDKTYPKLEGYFDRVSLDELHRAIYQRKRSFENQRAEYKSKNEGGPISMIPGVKFIPRGIRMGFNQEDDPEQMLASVLNGVKEVVLVEPHQDDIVIGVGAWLKWMQSKPGSNSILGTLFSVVDDVLGITNQYANLSIHGRRSDEHVSDDAKRSIRNRESKTVADGLKFSAVALELAVPLKDGTTHLDENGYFVGIMNEFEDFSVLQKEKMKREILRLIKDKQGTLLVLPFPFHKRLSDAPAEYIKGAHPHHTMTTNTILEILKELRYPYPIMFYEVPERISNFQTEGIVPNFVFAFDQQRLDEKKNVIAQYLSQVDRWVQSIPESRRGQMSTEELMMESITVGRANKDHASFEKSRLVDSKSVLRGDISSFDFMERFLVGRLEYDSPAGEGERNGKSLPSMQNPKELDGVLNVEKIAESKILIDNLLADADKSAVEQVLIPKGDMNLGLMDFDAIITSLESGRSEDKPAAFAGFSWKEYSRLLLKYFIQGNLVQHLGSAIGNKSVVIPIFDLGEKQVEALIRNLPGENPVFLMCQAPSRNLVDLASKSNGRIQLFIRDNKDMDLESTLGLLIKKNNLISENLVLALPTESSFDFSSTNLSKSILKGIEILLFDRNFNAVVMPLADLERRSKLAHLFNQNA